MDYKGLGSQTFNPFFSKNYFFKKHSFYVKGHNDSLTILISCFVDKYHRTVKIIFPSKNLMEDLLVASNEIISSINIIK